MNLLTISKVVQKLEEWADHKIPELVPGPKLEVMVSLSRLVGDQLDELIKSLRLDGKTKWAKIVKEDLISSLSLVKSPFAVSTAISA
jgi:hypothetical protein